MSTFTKSITWTIVFTMVALFAVPMAHAGVDPVTGLPRASSDGFASQFNGDQIWNGGYLNGWSQAGAITPSLNGTDLNLLGVDGNWLEGTTSGWNTGNQGDWTFEVVIRYNNIPNGFAFWQGVGWDLIVWEAYPGYTQDGFNTSGGNTFSVAHNNHDGQFHTYRVVHDSFVNVYHVWRDGVLLTAAGGVPYDSGSNENRLIIGDYTGGNFGDGFNVDIASVRYDQTGAYAPVGLGPVCAYDDASDAAYAGGWPNNSDGGAGFGPWTLYTSGPDGFFAGHIIQTSTDNGNGDSNSDGDINIAGDAWGMYAGNGGLAEAFRTFDALEVGDTFIVEMDSGYVDGGGAVGIDLRSGGIGGTTVAGFLFGGGGTHYTVVDSNGSFLSTVGYSDEGLALEFTIVSATTFDLSIYDLAAGSAVTTYLGLPLGGAIDTVRLYNSNAGGGTDHNTYFNTLCIEAPAVTIASPGDVTICDTHSTDPDVNPAVGIATAEGGCDEPDITYVDDGTTSPITRTWTATDLASGSTASIDQIITLDPNVCPCSITIDPNSCPPDQNINAVDSDTLCEGVAPDGASLILYSASGDCGPIGVDQDPPAGSALSPNITHTITITVYDTNEGLTGPGAQTCTYDVTVLDITAPVITCPADEVIECDATPVGVATATDACANPDVTFSDYVASGSQSVLYEATSDDVASNPQNQGWLGFEVSVPPGTDIEPNGLIDFPANNGPVLTTSGVPAWQINDQNGAGSLNLPTYFYDFDVAETAAMNALGFTLTLSVESLSNSGYLSFGVNNTAGSGTLFGAPSGNEYRFGVGAGNVPVDGAVHTVTWTWDPVAGTVTWSLDGGAATIIPPQATNPFNGGFALQSRSQLSAGSSSGTGAIFSFTKLEISVGDGCPQGQTIVRTWTATDDDNNSSSCAQVITVQDTTAPVVNPPAGFDVECGDPNPGFGTPSPTDNCTATVDLTVVIDSTVTTPGTCGLTETQVRTWTVTDACGNSASGSQTINVVDTTPPSISCPAQVDVQCTADIPAADINDVTASDTCGTVTVIHVGDVSDNLTCPETITRTYRATDDCGLTADCTQLIVVDDTIDPTITCPADVTLDADANCEAPIPDLVAGSTTGDNCGVASVTQSPTALTLVGPGTTVVTVTVTDLCGNTADCPVNVTIEDNEAPSLTCPPDLTIALAAPANYLQLSYASGVAAAPGAAPAADPATQGWTFIGSGSGFADGYDSADGGWRTVDGTGDAPAYYNRALTGTEAANLAGPWDLTWTLTLDADAITSTGGTVADYYLPPNNGRQNTNYLSVERTGTGNRMFLSHRADASGNLLIYDGATTHQITTAGGNVAYNTFITLTVSHDGAGAYTLSDGTTTWNLAALNGSQNRMFFGPGSSGGQGSVVWNDVTLDTLPVPCTAVIPDVTLLADSAADFSGTQGQDGWEYRQFYAGGCGIGGNDTQLPTFTGFVWADFESFGTAFLDENGGHPGVDTLRQAVRRWTSDYTGFVTITGDFYDRDTGCGDGAHVRIFQNCGQVWEYLNVPAGSTPYSLTLAVTAGDTIDFVIDPIFDAGCDDTQFTAQIHVAAVDNCDGVVAVTQSPAVGTVVSGVGTTVVTLSATDAAGNPASCSDTDVDALDVTDPEITCPGPIAVQCSADVPAADVNLVTATDNCDVTVTHVGDASDGNTCPEIITRTYRATDAGGNIAECTQLITVGDTTAPVLDPAPAAIAVQCVADVPAPADLGWTDNCDGAGTVTSVDGPLTGGACGGTITRTWDFSDSCGNAAVQRVQVITVDDTTAPVLDPAPAAIAVQCEADVPAAADLGYTDNCDGAGTVTSVDGPLTGGACGGTITRTWDISDSCGNPAVQRVQIITVDDTTAPVLDAAPVAIAVECEADVPAPADLGWTDNCDGAGTVTSVDGPLTGGACGGTITRTWDVSDACGNPAVQRVQVITVDDTTIPVLVCPPDATVECDADSSPAGIAGSATATDNCDGVVTPTFVDFPHSAGLPTVNSSTFASQFNGDEIWNSGYINGWSEINDGGTVETLNGTILHYDHSGSGVASTLNGTASTVDAGATTWNTANNVDWSFEISIRFNNVPNGFAVWQGVDTDRIVFEVYNDRTQDNGANTFNVAHTNNDGEFHVYRVAHDSVNNVYHVWRDGVSLTATGGVPYDSTSNDNRLLLGDYTKNAFGNNFDVDIAYIRYDQTAATAPDFCTGEHITRQWTATDACGNSDSCDQLVTIVDTTPPVIAGVSDVVIECDEDSSPAETGQATATDNCDANPTVDYIEGGILDAATGLPELDSSAFAWGYEMDVDPITQDLDSNGGGDWFPNGTPPVSGGVAQGGNGFLYRGDFNSPAPSIWRAAIPNGNYTVEFSARALLTGTEGANGTLSLASDKDGGGIDGFRFNVSRNGTGLKLSKDDVDTNINTDGFHVFRVARVDTGGTPTYYLWRDGVLLTAGVAPNNSYGHSIFIGDFSGGLNGGWEIDYIRMTGSAFAPDSGFVPSCANESEFSRTWSAVDACGNAADLVQVIISLEDTTPPVITTPADVTVQCDSIPAVGTATALDNCGDSTVVYDGEVRTDGNCADNYTLTRTWTATDECENSSSASQTITVQDTTIPVVTAPIDATVECNTDSSSATTGEATATDNCGAVTITQSDSFVAGACGAEGVITRTWTGTDACGNIGTDIQLIVVVDTTDPVITCPADETIECNTDPVGVATATDNCDNDVDITFADAPSTAPTVLASYFAGFAGNPVTAPDPQTQGWTFVDNSGGAVLVEPVSPDGVSGYNAWKIDDNFTFGGSTANYTFSAPFGPTEVALAATEGWQYTIRSRMIVGPSVDINMSYNAGVGADRWLVWFTVDINDNLIATPQNGSAINLGMLDGAYHTYTILNTSGTGAGQLLVDGVAVGTVPVDTGASGTTGPRFAAGSSGNTGEMNFNLLQFTVLPAPIVVCDATEIYTRTWTATDDCGHTDTCEQTIVVHDTTAPDISCPGDDTIECGDAAAGVATATDNCDPAPYVTSVDGSTGLLLHLPLDEAAGAPLAEDLAINGFDFVPTGVTAGQPGQIGGAYDFDGSDTLISVERNVIRNGGLLSGASISVWINTTSGASSDHIVSVEGGWAITYNAGGIQPIFDGSSGDGPPNLATGLNDGNWHHLVAVNNGSTTTLYVDGVVTGSGADTPLHSLNGLDRNTAVGAFWDGTSRLFDGLVDDVSIWGRVLSADEIAALHDSGREGLNASEALGTCPETINRTWIAVDNCGNVSTCPQEITVEDTTAPDITCPADVTVECDVELTPANTGTATATDTCSDTTVTFRDSGAVDGTSGLDAMASIDFDYRYEMAVAPNNQDLDNNGTDDWWDAGVPTINNGIAEGGGGNLFRTDFGDSITRANFADDAPYTIEFRARVLQSGGTEGSAGSISGHFWRDPDDSTAILYLKRTGQSYSATSLGTDSNTDGFHTFRVARAANGDIWVWKDNVLLNPGGTALSESTVGGATGLFVGDTGGSVNGDWQVDYIRIAEGAYAPAAGVFGAGVAEPYIFRYDAGLAPEPVADPADAGMVLQFLGGGNVGPEPNDEDGLNGWRIVDGGGGSRAQYNVDAQQVAAASANGWVLKAIVRPISSAQILSYAEADGSNQGGSGSPHRWGLSFLNSGGNLRIQTFGGASWTDVGTSSAEYQEIKMVNAGGDNDDTLIYINEILLPFVYTGQNSGNSIGGVTMGSGSTGGSNTAHYNLVEFSINAVEDEDCPQNGLVRRTWTATDDCGNVSECEQLITVVDTTAPVITCPADVILECDEGNAVGVFLFSDDFESDVTGSPLGAAPVVGAGDIGTSWTHTSPANVQTGFGCASGGNIQPRDHDLNSGNWMRVRNGTSTATLAGGGTTLEGTTIAFDMHHFTSGTINRRDRIRGQGDAVSFDVEFGSAGSGNMWINGVPTADPGNGYEGLRWTRVEITLHATTWDLTVTAYDPPRTPPCIVVTGLNPTQTTTFTGLAYAFGAPSTLTAVDFQSRSSSGLVFYDNIEVTNDEIFGMATATDNCTADEDVVISVSESTAAGTCPQESVTTRTWTATDECGLSSSCDQTITVQDSVAPVLDAAPANVTVECLGDVPAMTDLDYTDNCDVPGTVTGVEGPLTGGICGGTITRTWDVSDACGNPAVQRVQIITVDDTTDPVILCPDDVTVECNTSTDPVDTGTAGATDNCDLDPVVTYSDAVATGSQSVLYEATSDDVASNPLNQGWLRFETSVPPGTDVNADGLIDFPDNNGPVLTTSGVPAWQINDQNGAGSLNLPTFLYDFDVTETATMNALGFTLTLSVESLSNSGFLSFGVNNTAGSGTLFGAPSGNEYRFGVGAGNVPVDGAVHTVAWTWDPVAGQVTRSLDGGAPTVLAPQATNPFNGGFSQQSRSTLSAGSSSGTTAIFSFTGLEISVGDGCSQGQTITRTWTATDDCGNTDSCDQIITVVDTTDPVLTVPVDTTAECDAVPAVGTATATDNCDGDVDVVYDGEVRIDGVCDDTYTLERTWTATDDCGNSTTLTQTIAVSDNTDPVLTVPGDVTVQCPDSTDPTATGEATATDNCDVPTGGGAVTVYAEGFTGQNGKGALGDTSGIPTIDTTGVTWTIDVSDAELTADTDWFMVVVDDRFEARDVDGPARWFSPVINISSLSGVGFSLDATEEGDHEASDYVDVYYSIDGGSWVLVANWNGKGSATHTLVGDIPTDLDWESETVTVTGLSGSTLELLVVFENGAGSEYMQLDDVVVTGTGVSGGPDVVYSDSSVPGCGATETITRTWTATDDCGNSTSLPQVITVVDTVDPVLAMPDDVTVECDEANDSSATGVATATDDCDTDVTVIESDSVADGACPDESIITRTWTATDDCGNTDIQVQTITVVDSEPPVLVVPGDVTVQCPDPTDPSATGTASATDNCDVPAGGVVTAYAEGFTGQNGKGAVGPGPAIDTTGVTWTIDVSDAALTASSDWFMVVVDDHFEARDVDGPAKWFSPVVNISGLTAVGFSLDATEEGDHEGSDYMDVYYSIDGGSWVLIANWNGLGSATHTLVGDIPTDLDWESETVTVSGLSGSTLELLVVFENGAGSEYMQLDNVVVTGFGGVGGPDVSYLDSSVGGCGATETITRTWTATDNCGNAISLPQVITVVDDVDPVLTVPADTTAECDAVPAVGTATATDDCDADVTVTYDGEVRSDGACDDTYTLVRTWTATDDCGNTDTQMQTIEVSDNTAPVLTVPVDVTVQCPDSTEPSATGTATATDNCDVAVDGLVTAYAEGFTGQNGKGALGNTSGTPTIDTAGVTWTIDVSDAALTATTDWFMVVVDDHFEARDVDGPARWFSPIVDISGLSGVGFSLDATEEGDHEASDYIDVYYSVDGGTWVLVANWNGFGSATHTLVGDIPTDEDWGSETVTVTGLSGSTLELLVVFENGAGTEYMQLDNVVVTGTGLSGGPDVTYLDSSVAGCGATETITRTWTATDNCGNATSLPQVITVVDTVAPVLTVPASVTVECDEPSDSSATGVATATDDCDNDVTVTESDSVAAGACADESVITRTWTATDDCDNVTSLAQVITVVDTSNPTASNPLPVTVECSEDVPVPDIEVVTDEEDNCDDVPTVEFVSDVSDGSTCPEVITRTYSVTDNCGNSITVTQTITVDDVTPPTITLCPADVTFECDGAGNVAEVQAWLDTFAATDNCIGDVTLEDDFVALSDDCGATGSATVTFTATDNCSNVTTCQGKVTVVDTTAPGILVPADVTLECPADTGTGANGTATGDDVCGDVVITYVDDVVDDCGATETITRTWTATDDCGNSTSDDQVITVVDTTDPVITCPADFTTQCVLDSDYTGVAGVATATDECDSDVDITYTDVEDGACPYTITRTWLATDDCGNTDSCVQLITVEDTMKPVLTGCPDDVVIKPCDDIPAPAVVTALDQCEGDLTVTYTEQVVTNSNFDANSSDDSDSSNDGYSGSSDGSSEGSHDGSTPVNNVLVIRTYTATDSCGNSISCTQIITIDNQNNCVRSQGYWKNHASAWPVDTLDIGCEEDVPQAQLLTWMNQSTHGDATIILVKQLIAALLNVEQGACAVGQAEACIADAQALLCTYPVGSYVPKSDRRLLTDAAKCLDKFNNAKLKDDDCCDGGITQLELVYNGGSDLLNVSIADTDFPSGSTIVAGSTFTINGTKSDGKMDSNTEIKSNGSTVAEIHTSCSKPIYVGLVAGDFTVLAGTSRDGGALCEAGTFPPRKCSDGAPNHPPVAVDDMVTTYEDTPLNIDILANDMDVDGDDLMVLTVTDPASGTLTVNVTGTITYTPNPGFVGADSFTYVIIDGNGGASGGVVCVTVEDLTELPPDWGECTEDLNMVVGRSKIEFGGSTPYTEFKGAITTSGGNIANDFRTSYGPGAALGTLKVTVGTALVYDNNAIEFDVNDVDAVNNKEKWEFKASSKEKVSLKWKETQYYDANRDPALAALGVDVGKFYSRYIHADETMFRFYFKHADLPLTITIDGIPLVVVNADEQVVYSVDPDYELKRGKHVDVRYPEKLVPEQTIEWWEDDRVPSETEPPDNWLAEQVANENGAATATYFNGGGEFFIVVPIDPASGVDRYTTDLNTSVELSIGEANVTLVGCGEFDVNYDDDDSSSSHDRCHRHRHGDDNSSD